jgi:hypothetical protein
MSPTSFQLLYPAIATTYNLTDIALLVNDTWEGWICNLAVARGMGWRMMKDGNDGEKR